MSLGVELTLQQNDILKIAWKVAHKKTEGLEAGLYDETRLSNDFINNFSKNSKNKDDINKHLAQKFLILHESDIIPVVIFNDSILSNAVLHKPLISSCTSEQADQRIIPLTFNLADIYTNGK